MVKRRRGRLRRWLLGVPGLVFRSRFGFLFRKRLICIEHEGRHTAERYVTPVEVLYRDKASDEYYVVSARGERADWYQNIQKYPASAVYIASRRRPVRQRIVPIDEAVAVMKIYEKGHPKAARALFELSGATPNVSTEPWRVAMKELPMVAFQPR